MRINTTEIYIWESFDRDEHSSSFTKKVKEVYGNKHKKNSQPDVMTIPSFNQLSETFSKF